MATLVLSAAGAAIGSGFGGAVLGLSGMVIGRAVGATLGRAIDQRLMGRLAGGSQPVEMGRIERLRLTGASEGAPMAQAWGRVRLGGQVIWASDFIEDMRVSGGGGGGKRPRQPTVTEYAYSVSLAVALGQGPILGIGRIWADGQEIAPGDLNLRVYTGTEDQLPDPLIEAVQGAGRAPAYRGTAYVVIEDLALGAYGNRVPQLSFEVLRAVQDTGPQSLGDHLQAVALMPGSGDFMLSTDPVYTTTTAESPHLAPQEVAQNLNSPSGLTDLDLSLDQLSRELPNVGSSLLVVCWFGSDLRAGECRIEPKVEFADRNAPLAPWSVAGRSAAQTPEVARLDGRPVYGGTPSDASVLQAIAALKARGQKVVYYPFILMEILPGNALPDPWSQALTQPALPWRGRITTDTAPGQPGSPDGTEDALDEVAAFFGTAQASDFTISGGAVTYAGPQEWRYRRFILQQAALCKAAGGVDAFCIGSEMRALTQIRGPANSFPAVAALIALAAEVRALLGPEVTITYAADWSEYFGYVTAEGDRFFHLDPLWADDNIDVIGIDNYMPLSDWRDGDDHADARAGWDSIHDLDYLKANIVGGEGFDWFYASDQDRAAQIRTPIRDDSDWAEHWIWRIKDLRNWWGNDHHDRVGGVRNPVPTAWEPRSKPIWFTEYGCAAIDRGTNQPNVFLDAKSSESRLPHFSRGGRDDTIQMQYFRAMGEFWADPANNPVSELYGGPMVDMTRAHAWAWDARPWPWFPGNRALWEDGGNWARGHWLTGRATGQPLDAVIGAICRDAGLPGAALDLRRVHGVVRGFAQDSTETPRAALQSLMLAYGVEAAERDGKLVFFMRNARALARLGPEDLVRRDGGDLTLTRAPQAELSGRVRLGYVAEDAQFEMRMAEASLPDASLPDAPSQSAARRSSGSDLPLVLTEGEAQHVAERWLAESQVARDVARFTLPPSCRLGAGDVVRLAMPDGPEGLWRIDRASLGLAREIEALRVEPGLYGWDMRARADRPLTGYEAPPPVQPLFLDLPLLSGEETPQAPWLALQARPWPGAVAVHHVAPGPDFVLEAMVAAQARIGVTQTPLRAAPSGLWDRGDALRVRMLAGEMASALPVAVLEGANLMAIGTGGAWEVLQFAEAELVAPDTWDLRLRLRGQRGTDAVMPETWPPGALVVMLDARLTPLPLPLEALGLERRYRIGPALRPLEDPSHRDVTAVFEGVGLRPLRPVHLRAVLQQDGAFALRWIRRTRRGGDGWSMAEVPLSEAFERYRLRVVQGAEIRREVMLEQPEWHYPLALRQADGVAGQGFAVEVAQISDLVGAGPAARIELS